MTIIPLEGGIQYEKDADPERVARAEKNMACQAVAACRQHAGIDRFDNARAYFRMGEGRKECEQWYQEVRVSREKICLYS